NSATQQIAVVPIGWSPTPTAPTIGQTLWSLIATGAGTPTGLAFASTAPFKVANNIGYFDDVIIHARQIVLINKKSRDIFFSPLAGIISWSGLTKETALVRLQLGSLSSALPIYQVISTMATGATSTTTIYLAVLFADGKLLLFSGLYPLVNPDGTIEGWTFQGESQLPAPFGNGRNLLAFNGDIIYTSAQGIISVFEKLGLGSFQKINQGIRPLLLSQSFVLDDTAVTNIFCSIYNFIFFRFNEYYYIYNTLKNAWTEFTLPVKGYPVFTLNTLFIIADNGSTIYQYNPGGLLDETLDANNAVVENFIKPTLQVSYNRLDGDNYTIKNLRAVIPGFYCTLAQLSVSVVADYNSVASNNVATKLSGEFSVNASIDLTGWGTDKWANGVVPAGAKQAILYSQSQQASVPLRRPSFVGGPQARAFSLIFEFSTAGYLRLESYDLQYTVLRSLPR
ncbi:MAG: hypothetical protein ORO03_10240, partial [Alphaproteobacteria bacterium]|nr:hypothetical protein [Alphaproteobacteria bacterium]